jgi:serine/threonine protein kinase
LRRRPTRAYHRGSVKVCDVCGGRYKDKGLSQICPFDGAVLRQLPDPFVGRTIGGRYVIASKLGGGGFGVVYRATNEVVGREVAIKFLLPELALDPTNRERFLREAKAANRIDHEHIIDINDFGETDDGLVYLVMELLVGRTLSAEIARGPLGVLRAVEIAMQCAGALARAHELDVVHRDIKPDNIYLVDHPSRRDHVKLLDFGLAQMKGELRITATGAVFGTPEYMPPEQARGAPITSAADLYGLGCVLYEMVTGKLPFTGSTPDLVLKHLRETAPPLSRLVPDVPPLLEELVKKLLEKEPKKRHRDAHHLIEELRRVAELHGPRPMSLPPEVAPTLLDLPVLSQPPASTRRRDVLPPTSAAPRAPEPAAPAARLRLGTGQLAPAWAQRAELFRALVPQAHGTQVPAWLLPSIDQLAATIAEGVRVADELAQLAGAVSQREGELRQVRLRLGRAIDELGRDESRTLGKADDLQRRLGEASARLAAAGHALGRSVAGMTGIAGSVPARPSVAPARPSTSPGIGQPAASGRELATAVLEAAVHASGYLEADAFHTSLSDELTRCEREMDDLRFQLASLKGRLGGLNAEQDLELSELRRRTAELDKRSDAIMESVAQRAGILTEHFAAFPALRDLVRSAAEPRALSSAPGGSRR